LRAQWEGFTVEVDDDKNVNCCQPPRSGRPSPRPRSCAP